MNINFKDPSIELISRQDDSQKVWLISRPHLSEHDPELMKIKTMDLPVNDFDKLTFKITSSLLIRDLLYHIRPSADWARSNRTTRINKETLFYSSEYKYNEYKDSDDLHRFEKTHEYITDENTNLDIRKDRFPYSVSTDYCWGCDIRTLISLLRSMKKYTPYIFEVYGKLFLDALGMKFEELPPSSDSIINEIACYQDFGDNSTVKVDDTFGVVMIQYTGKGSLLSQFIRQHRARVRSSLIYRLRSFKTFEQAAYLNQDELFTMQSITTKELAQKLMKTRACWFSKQDKKSKSSWSAIVSALIKETGMKFEECLPCDGCLDKCPWKSEQLARCLANKPGESKGEVNPPCVLITGLPQLGKLRKAKFNSDSELYQHWLKYCETMKFEPTQYGRDYIDNVLNYGFVEPCDNANPQMMNIVLQIKEEIKKLDGTD